MKKLTKKIATLACSATAICALAFGGISAINASADNTSFEMINGASVRVDKTGIRFSCTVNESYLSGLTAVGGEYAGYTAELGTVIVPTVVLGGSELTATQTYTYNETVYETLKIALTKKDADKSTASMGYYNAVVIDIPAISYETDLSARSYIKLTKNETTEYIYTDVTAVRSIGYVAVEAYNDAKTSAEQKEGLKKLLDVNLGTIGFDKATYEVNAGEEIAYKVTANEYGYVLDSTALVQNNAIFTSNNTNVAKVENGKIVGVAAGEAEITVKIGEKTAKASVTVNSVSVEDMYDSTGRITWKGNQNVSVTYGDFTFTNSPIGGMGTSPKKTGYTIKTNGEFVDVVGKLNLTSGLRVARIASTELPPASGTTKLSGNQRLLVRLTDATDSSKVLTFNYYVADNVGLFQYDYKGTTSVSNANEYGGKPMYGFNFGNTTATYYDWPELVYHGDYQFGYGKGAITDWANTLTASLREDNFGANGVYVSFSSGTTGGMFVYALADFT